MCNDLKITLHDNDLKDIMKAALKWFKSKHLNILEWAIQRPNLNSIEDMCYDLKITIHQSNPFNLKELPQFCIEQQAKIPESS